MPILILPPRTNPDATAVRAAATAAGWHVEQLANWRAPVELRGRDLVLYGEPLFADEITPARVLPVLCRAARNRDMLGDEDRQWLRQEFVIS